MKPSFRPKNKIQCLYHSRRLFPLHIGGFIQGIWYCITTTVVFNVAASFTFCHYLLCSFTSANLFSHVCTSVAFLWSCPLFSIKTASMPIHLIPVSLAPLVSGGYEFHEKDSSGCWGFQCACRRSGLPREAHNCLCATVPCSSYHRPHRGAGAHKV